MQEQNKRAIESMCRCGLSLKELIVVFPSFPQEDIENIYNAIVPICSGVDTSPDISINCS